MENDSDQEDIVPVSQDDSQNIFSIDVYNQLILQLMQISIAPGEEKKPYSILENKQFEELTNIISFREIWIHVRKTCQVIS